MIAIGISVRRYAMRRGRQWLSVRCCPERRGGRRGPQRGVATCACAADDDASPINRPVSPESLDGVNAFGDVQHSPVAAERVAVGAPVAGAAPIVHVEHRETVADEELDPQVES